MAGNLDNLPCGTNISNRVFNLTTEGVGGVEIQPLMSSVPGWCLHSLTVYMSIVFMVGLPGNIVVMFAEIKQRSKSATDWFVLYLAMLDVLSLSVTAPVYIMQTTSLWRLVGSTIGCKLLHLTINFTCTGSTVTICFIALERFSKTTGTLNLFTPKSAAYSGIGVFVISMLIGAPALVYTNDFNRIACTYGIDKKRIAFLTYAFFLALAFICTCITCIVYVKVVKHMRQKIIPMAARQQEQRSTMPTACKREGGLLGCERVQKVTLAMALVSTVFIISTVGPAVAALLLTSLNVQRFYSGRIVIFILLRLFMVNNCANPLFYFYLNTSFRNKVKAMLTVRTKNSTHS